MNLLPCVRLRAEAQVQDGQSLAQQKPRKATRLPTSIFIHNFSNPGYLLQEITEAVNDCVEKMKAGKWKPRRDGRKPRHMLGITFQGKMER